jgi:FKBP-type peptidyl-prolyl cis-trans isomerase
MSAAKLFFAIVALFVFAACSADDPKPAAARAADTKATTAPAKDELVITDLKVGQGEPIVAGSVAVVHYTGWLYDAGAPENKGSKFDSSVDRNEPFAFPLGAGQVIAGWDEGVAGMKAGGKRRLVIPAAKAYGDRGAGGVIPPGATLVFDVELIRIE